MKASTQLMWLIGHNQYLSVCFHQFILACSDLDLFLVFSKMKHTKAAVIPMFFLKGAFILLSILNQVSSEASVNPSIPQFLKVIQNVLSSLIFLDLNFCIIQSCKGFPKRSG